MRKIFLIFFIIFISFLFIAPSTYASTIFYDTFQGGIKTSYWTLLSNTNWGNYFQTSSFGIQDTSTQGYYSVLDLNSSKYANDSEIKIDVKISNDNPSNFDIFCRKTPEFLYGAQFYPAGNGNTLDTFNGVDFVNYNWDNSNGIHKFDVLCNQNNIVIKEDGKIIYEDPTHAYQSFKGLNIEFSFGDGHSSEFANFQLCDINGCDPSGISLSVPLIKQTDPAWKNFTYDSADKWAPNNPTIGNWGCALTSAVMVMKYYHIDKLPGQGNSDLTPALLDAWLNVQPDGYIPNGNINWLALSRLTKQAKTNNPNFLYDALQFSRINGTNTTTLLSDLTNNQPDILEEPGHFVVATGQNNSNIFTINDPYFSKTLLSDYGNTFTSLNRFIPSHTDLSYLLFSSSPQINLTLKTASGSAVGESYIQQPLVGDDSNTTSGHPVQILTLQQPDSGSYSLVASGSPNQTFTIKGYLYDKDGNVSPFTENGVTNNNLQTFIINFDNSDITKDSISKTVTFNSLLDDLTNLYKLGFIKKGAYNSLQALGRNAKNQNEAHRTFVAKIDLGIMITILQIQKGHEVNNAAFDILSQDVQYLQKHL